MGDSQSAISFVLQNGHFVIETGEASNPSFTVAFTGERYIMTIPQDNTPLTLNTEEGYTVNSGENLEVIASAIGESTVIRAELYEGILPVALLGRDFTQASDIMAESQPLAAFINSQGYFVFNTKGLSGNYYLRLLAQAENGAALCRYLPVSIMNGGQLVTGLADFYRQGEAISLNLALNGGDDLAYEVLLDDVQVDDGAAEHDVIVDLGTPELGRHICKVNLSRSGLTVASEVLEFTVYSAEPGFMAVSDEPTDSAAEIYAVPGNEAAYFQKLFAYNLFPGNQLLQVMGRQEFYSSLRDNSGLLATYINNDLSSYQNADGSFSRLPGAKGDMLLSALVADSGGVEYDKGDLEEVKYATTKNFYHINKHNNPRVYTGRLWQRNRLGR